MPPPRVLFEHHGEKFWEDGLTRSVWTRLAVTISAPPESEYSAPSSALPRLQHTGECRDTFRESRFTDMLCKANKD